MAATSRPWALPEQSEGIRHGRLGEREGLVTCNSPQLLTKTVFRGRFHIARAFWARSSPRNSAKSLNCRIRSPGL